MPLHALCARKRQTTTIIHIAQVSVRFDRLLKYCPMWPSQGFTTLEDAREWVQQYMTWYNHEHRHSAIKFVTPAQRHAGDDVAILAKRHAVYKQARTDRPDHWSCKTRNWDHGREVALNPDRPSSPSDILIFRATMLTDAGSFCRADSKPAAHRRPTLPEIPREYRQFKTAQED